MELVDTLDSKSNASNSVWVRLPPEVRINHNRVEIQASSKKEARLFFGAMRRVSCCGFQNEREGRNYNVIQPHPRYENARFLHLAFLFYEMVFTYSIRSLSRNYLYVGISNNPIRRLKEHNLGYNRKTKAYRPFELIYVKEFDSRAAARLDEKTLKSGSGKEFLKELG